MKSILLLILLGACNAISLKSFSHDAPKQVNYDINKVPKQKFTKDHDSVEAYNSSIEHTEAQNQKDKEPK